MSESGPRDGVRSEVIFQLGYRKIILAVGKYINITAEHLTIAYPVRLEQGVHPCSVVCNDLTCSLTRAASNKAAGIGSI